MSGAKPPKGGGKPFLGEGDLHDDLDAWDATFDALHGEDAGGAKAPPMEWPAPTPEPGPDPTAITVLPPDDDGEQMTLDRALEAAPAGTGERAGTGRGATLEETYDAADDTDFSDVGADGPPAALGGLLGRGETLPPIDGDDDDDDDRTRVEIHSGPHRTATPPPSDDDEEVFTSASRPVAAVLPDFAFDDDSVAPPPPPEPRRGPAIIRRSQPLPAVRGPMTPAHGVEPGEFAEERTRVADLGQIEEQRQASRPLSKTAPPPIAYEEDEYEVEIEAAPAGEIQPHATPDPSLLVGRQRTAHVVRRSESMPRQPAPVTGPSEVVELEVMTPPPGASPGAEDDFSDVAVAVGAAGDPLIDFDDSLPTPPPRESPRPVAALDDALAALDDGPAMSPALDDALASFDDGSAEPVSEQSVMQVEDDPLAPFDADTDEPLTRTRPAAPATPPFGTAAPSRPTPRPRPIDPRADPDDDPRPLARIALTKMRVKTPTSVPQLATVDPSQLAEAAAMHSRSPRLATAIPVELEAPPEIEIELDLDKVVRAWPEQVDPISSSTLDEAAAAALQIYERELAEVDDSEASAPLRVEAGRLAECLMEIDRARAHYDAALLADPRATPALRGLRRLARNSGDLVEAVRQLDAEIAVAGALERRPLGHYRVDLLMASDEQDLARVAVGEILDSAPSDVRALLAQLELAFLDGRADEFGVALEKLAHAVIDPELRAAVQGARGGLAAHHNEPVAAAEWFAAAAESDPTALSARIGAIRHAAGQADGVAAGRALLDLAAKIAAVDPVTAAAAAVRAQQWQAGEIGAAAATLAVAVAPADPLVARLAAECADGTSAADAYAHWAAVGATDAERAYAAARAAELDPGRAVTLWSAALELDPGDDYGAAQLRTAHVASEATSAAIEVDLAVATDADRERARLRAAYGLIAQEQLEVAVELLTQGRAERPGALAIAEALGEAFAASSQWSARARLFAELAAEPGAQLDREVAQLRSAIAWEEAVGAASATESPDTASEELQIATAAALEAWERVLETAGSIGAPSAHAAAIVLASRINDRDVLAEVLSRAQTSERSPLAAASLALRRARLFPDDPGRADSVLRSVDTAGADDPRLTVAIALTAARDNQLGEAAAAIEARAVTITAGGAATEVAALRLRAAQLAVDGGDAPRAVQLLTKVEAALPQVGVVSDLLAAARRRAGERPVAVPSRPGDTSAPAAGADAFVRFVRDADLASIQGDQAAALSLYQRALELKPHDPLASEPMIRIATQLREAAPVAGVALARLRVAEEAGDGGAKAAAYELLAHIDGELRGDQESAQVALESAVHADPDRLDLILRLQRRYASTDQLPELLRLRKAELGAMPEAHLVDRAALLVDLAGLSTRDGRPEVEVAEFYRAVLALDPEIARTARLALMHLEATARLGGYTAELAELEDRIAAYFEGDPKSQAAFLTRAGETLAELGRIDEAVVRFGRAEAGLPGHVPALDGWRMAALKGQLWIDVAEASTRQALGAPDEHQRAMHHHFAGVALMDKALAGEQAMVAFRNALDAEPGHRDAFLRLRILLEEDANHDDLATLLTQRLEVEEDPTARIELHRALAELHRNFLSDRDNAKEHYRFILDADPNDLRAHAAVADIAWEQGNWQEAADALMARARLEREPEILKTLCFRLGLIYADRLVDVPMALKAFQRALTYQPDDEATLIRLADLATEAGEWKLALAACERLVKHEEDPDRRVAHLQRVAKIFKDGFGDNKRAERALNLALDGAPTNDLALTKLVEFYRSTGDTMSVRVHLNRVAGSMRVRAAENPQDGVAYRVVSRAMSARADAGVAGSLPIARAAAELADLLGASGEPEQALLRRPPAPDLAPLLKPEADEVLFPRGVQPELRQVFQLLGDRIAKHVGVDLRPYGVTRGDRLRGKDDPTSSVAQSVASGLGFGEIDVYVSERQPWVMVAEPTSPVSLVIGASVVAAGGDAIRFAAGSALKLAQASLAIPARLPADELGVLVVALLRLFQPEFPDHNVDADRVAAQYNKLRRLIPSGMVNELRPFALAIDPQRFDHEALSRDLQVTGLRAGLVTSASLLAGLRVLAAQADGELPSFLADPVAQGLISFALSEDYAVVCR